MVKPNEYETKNGILKTTREYKVRQKSGIVGERTLKLAYTDAEMVLLMEKLPADVFTASVVEEQIFKAITGDSIGRAVKTKAKVNVDSVKMKKYVKALQTMIEETPNISSEEFETRLTAVADKKRLKEAEVEYLRSQYPNLATKSDEVEEDDIVF